ncbi:IPT/TIG domain-containing protein [bacterium]|nr:IPT/TIG domain-containing protein [bacterium]
MTRSILVLLACAFLLGGCGNSSTSPDDNPGDDGGDDGGNTGGEMPTVTGIHPVGAGPGFPVTITGRHFSILRHPGIVYLGGSYPATITDWSDTEIVFVMPDVPGNWVKVEIAFEDDVVDAGFMGSWEEGVIQLTNTSGGPGAGEPTWSANGEWVYYVQYLDKQQQYDLYRVPSTGGLTQRVTFTEYDEHWPDINFTSGELAYGRNQTSEGNTGDYDIWIALASSLTPVDAGFATQELLDRAPAWSRDVSGGVRMAWDEEDGGVFTIRLLNSGGALTDLTNGFNARFDPTDGDWLVFADYDFLTPYLWKIEISTGMRTALPTPNGARGAADWGVNGRIVYDSGDAAGDIWVMDADGTNHELLTGTTDPEYTPRWSPTADRVAFGSHRSGNYNVFVYTLPGARPASAR